MASTAVPAVSWQELVVRVREVFSSENVVVEEVKELMATYTSDPRDWEEFAKFDPHRYTRNLVDAGNGKYNLLVLCWGEGHLSPIHDHANSHCFMKILSGSLKETLFHWPEEGQCGSMTQRGSTTYNTDAVTYINDSIGLHCIENPSHTDTAVSLHIYCPPITCCKCFDQRTGKAKSCQVCFTTRCDSNTCSP